jgi:hypothetical protein
MKQIFSKKLFCTLLSIVLFMLLGVTHICCKPRIPETQIGGFSPGEAAEKLKTLGMPFPIDTGGWHTFVNVRENVIFRVLSEKKSGKWRLSRIMLVDKSVFPVDKLLEEHQLLTGSSLASFAPGKGLKLGAESEKVRNIYGVPDRIIRTETGEDWIYSGAVTLSIGLQNNRVVFYRLENNR